MAKMVNLPFDDVEPLLTVFQAVPVQRWIVTVLPARALPLDVFSVAVSLALML